MLKNFIIRKFVRHFIRDYSLRSMQEYIFFLSLLGCYEKVLHAVELVIEQINWGRIIASCVLLHSLLVIICPLELVSTKQLTSLKKKFIAKLELPPFFKISIILFFVVFYE